MPCCRYSAEERQELAERKAQQENTKKNYKSQKKKFEARCWQWPQGPNMHRRLWRHAVPHLQRCLAAAFCMSSGVQHACWRPGRAVRRSGWSVFARIWRRISGC